MTSSCTICAIWNHHSIHNNAPEMDRVIPEKWWDSDMFYSWSRLECELCKGCGVWWACPPVQSSKCCRCVLLWSVDRVVCCLQAVEKQVLFRGRAATFANFFSSSVCLIKGVFHMIFFPLVEINLVMRGVIFMARGGSLLWDSACLPSRAFPFRISILDQGEGHLQQ